VGWHGYQADPGAAGEEEIYIKCSQDGGQQWHSQATNASGTEEGLSLFPNLRLDAAGGIHLVWEEYQGGSLRTDYDAYYREGPVPPQKVYLPLVMKG
jgi:hypothetical protein